MPSLLAQHLQTWLASELCAGQLSEAVSPRSDGRQLPERGPQAKGARPPALWRERRRGAVPEAWQPTPRSVALAAAFTIAAEGLAYLEKLICLSSAVILTTAPEH